MFAVMWKSLGNLSEYFLTAQLFLRSISYPLESPLE